MRTIRITALTTLFLLAACLSAQTAHPVAHPDGPKIGSDLTTQTANPEPPVYSVGALEAWPVTNTFPFTTTGSTVHEPPCGWSGFTVTIGKDGKCHLDVPLVPDEWNCKLISGKPTVLRCTWKAKKP